MKSVASVKDRLNNKSKATGKTMQELLTAYGLERAIEIAKRLIAQGKLSLEDIADAADLPVEKVRELSEQRSA